MSDDDLLASVMRKLLTQQATERMGPYVDICDGSMCVDGWVEHLTDDEVAALRRVDASVRNEAGHLI